MNNHNLFLKLDLIGTQNIESVFKGTKTKVRNYFEVFFVISEALFKFNLLIRMMMNIKIRM